MLIIGHIESTTECNSFPRGTETNKDDGMDGWTDGENKLWMWTVCCILIVFANLNGNSVSSVFKQLAASMSVNATR